MIQPDAVQTDVNSLLVGLTAASIAVNAWFLRSVARTIERMTQEQTRHGNRLTWLEARANGHPRRRAHEDSGEYPQPEGA